MDKRLRLVKILHDRTAEGTVEWERTTTDGEFQVAFPTYSIAITSRPDYDADEPDYGLRIYNKDGDLIEEIWNTDLVVDGEHNPFLLLRSTYKTARRIAMGVEQALDALLWDLGDPGQLPF